MKKRFTKMKKRLLVGLMVGFALIGSGKALGQNVTWAMTAATTNTPSVTSGTGWTAYNQLIVLGGTIVTDYANAVAADGSTKVQRTRGSGLGNGALPATTDLANYVEYKIGAASGYNLSVSGISMDLGGGGSTSNVRADVYWSNDGFVTKNKLNTNLLVLPNNSSSPYILTCSYTPSITVSANGFLQVRVYPSLTATSTSKYLVSSNVKFTFTATAANTAPLFVTSSPTLTVCQDASATDFSNLMHVSDADASQTETWTQATGGAPTHGTLSITSATASSGSSDITPGGTMTYTPTAGYSGTDAFTIQVSDGTAKATKTVNVTVNAAVSIGVQPTSTSTYLQGATPTALQVSASGTGLTYQWWTCASDGSNSSALTGETNATYTPSTTTVGTTYYKCIVTGTCTSLTSNVASVVVSSASTPVISLSSGSTTQTVSAGSTIGSIVYTWSGAATSANVSWTGSSTTLPTGLSAASDNGAKTITISGVPSVAGTYNYGVTSTDGTNTSTPILTGTLTINLSTPDVSSGATLRTNQGFTAQWAAVTGVTSYTLKVYQGTNLVSTIPSISATATSQAVTGLSVNTTYTYTVTAIGDGSLVPSSNESSASASVKTLNTAKAITAFSIAGQQIPASINETAKTIAVYVPIATDLSSLTTSITVSDYASVNPAQGVTDFTSSPVQYTVTAEDGSQQVYNVTVAFGSSASDHFQSKTNGNWSDYTTWQSSSDNSSWINATLAPTSSAASVFIQGGNTVTIATATTIPTTTVDATSTLKATDAVTLNTSSTLTVSGTYEHALNGGVIPTATWNSGSTCLVDGVTSTAITSGTDQNFCNFTWNCPLQTIAASSNLWSDGRHITGNVTLVTGTGSLRLLSMAATVIKTVTIDGNFNISKGTGTNSTVYTNGSSAAGTAQLYIGGDFSTSAGSSFYFNNGSGGSACTLNVYGNFNNAGTLTSKTLTTDVANINFAKSGAQTYTGSGSIAALSKLTITVNAGSILSLGSNLTTNTLTINSGAELTNNANLTATTFNILSDATNGTGTYLDNGTTTVTTSNVNQYLPSGRNWYISSPVASAATSIITSSGNVLSDYSEQSSIWNTPTTDANFVVAKGYVVNLLSSGNVIFTGGALNNGTFTSQSLTSSGSTEKGFNLVGNPYPSYLNWLSVLASSSTSPTIEQTMWYRTKNNASTPAYVFDTFNATAGEGTNNNGYAKVTGQIPPMQAFWVRVTAGNTGTLGFDNTMRSHQDQSITTNRLKDRALVNTAQQVLRLQVSNAVNSDEAIVLFNPNASDGFDAYDSEKMSNNNVAIPEIYTLAGTEQVAINGLNSIATNPELPLGFITGASNTFTIKATELSNFDSSTKVYLKDNLLSTEQDLTDGTAYTFASDVASTTSRFSIIFKSVGITTGVQTASGDQSVLIYKNANNQIAVNYTGTINDNIFVSVYNALGQKLELKQITSTTTVIDKAFTSGVYVVIVNNRGKSTTKKVILN